MPTPPKKKTAVLIDAKKQARPAPVRVKGPPVLDPSSALPMKKGKPVDNVADQRASFREPLPPARRKLNDDTFNAIVNEPNEKIIPNAVNFYKKKLAKKKK